MTPRKNRKLVAVGVPLSTRSHLTESERISLQHLNHYLARYDRFFIACRGVETPEGTSLRRIDFDPRFFGSVKAHMRLLTSPDLYEAFSDYHYLLIYHLDALVFSDQLEEWCRKGFDYIAPPWIPHEKAPYRGDAGFEGKVGNGGFSLRRIDGFLGLLNSKRFWIDPVKKWSLALRSPVSYFRKLYKLAVAASLFLPFRNNIRKELAVYSYPEDAFWANRARHYRSSFRVATVSEALPFAFECVPRYCFEKNRNRLPFGCHAWERYDRAFWEPHLLR
jgi:hypothetical protein